MPTPPLIKDNKVGVRDVPVSPSSGGGPTAPAAPAAAQIQQKKKKLGYFISLTPIPGLTPSGIFPDGKAFHFQCGPLNQFGESSAFNFQDYGTLSGGQHSQRVGRQLRQVQLDTLFLDWEPHWALAGDGSGSYDAQGAKNLLRQIHDAGEPFRFTASQPLQDSADIDFAATIRSFSWNQQAGEIDAYYVSLQVTEFVTPDIKEFLSGGGHGHHRALPVTLEVAKLPKNRNTLHKLAKFYYGDPAKARVIAVYNSITSFPFSEVLTEKKVRRKKITVPKLKKAKKSK